MRPISQLTKKNLVGKKVLLRADLDVALKNGKVGEDFRLEKSLPTIEFLLKNGAQVTMIGHLGRKGESLRPVIKWFSKHLEARLPSGSRASKFSVLENLRRDPGEEKNDLNFATKLAAGFDLFVNDAFAVCHRRHASIVTLPKLLPAYAGLQLEQEVKVLSGLRKPAKTLFLIIAGAKFESKLPVVNKFLPAAEKVFIGGALANLFFKREGYETGQSFIDSQAPSITSLLKSPKIILPRDLMVKRAGGKGAILTLDHLRPGDTIVDAGPATLAVLAPLIENAQTIIWNGPLGVFEQGYADSTKNLAKLIAKSSAKVIIGGGDTVAALHSLKKLTSLTKLKTVFISTGGGAMLQYLATGTLPGLEALKARI